MNRPEQEPREGVSWEQASGAGLIAAFLLFALAAGAFVVINLYWSEIPFIAPNSSHADGSLGSPR